MNQLDIETARRLHRKKPGPEPETMSGRIIDMIRDNPGIQARTVHEKIGRDRLTIWREIARLSHLGRIFSIPDAPRHRYFASLEALESMRPQIMEELKAHQDAWKADRKVKSRDRARQAYQDKKAAGTLIPKTPKANIVKPKKYTPKAITISRPKPIPLPDKLAAFKQQEAAPFPDHLIQRIPTPPARFHVEPPRHGWASMGPGRYFG